MSTHDHHSFLFAPSGSKNPGTSRKVHIRRLYDILQLSLQCQQFSRAKRVWAILARCRDIQGPSLWTIGLQILVGESGTANNAQNSAEFLRTMMLQYPEDREPILKELVFRLIKAGRHREALDELEPYLPSFPYQDDPIYHCYAGLICLYLAQPQIESPTSNFDAILLRDSRSHFERAKDLDPENTVPLSFLGQIAVFKQVDQEENSDDESMLSDDSKPQAKRMRS